VTKIDRRTATLVAVVIFVIVIVGGWFEAGWLAHRRQYRSLGYSGPPSEFHEKFVRAHVHDGMRPGDVYPVLRPGARVSYFIEPGEALDSTVVQWFDYKILGSGPFVAVLYRRGADGLPVVRDVYTDSYGVDGARRLSERDAYAMLDWNPSPSTKPTKQ
jgi:hypothetical protein